MKFGISRFVVEAAIAALVVISGSTAAWAQNLGPCPASPTYASDFSSRPDCVAVNQTAGILSNVLQLTSSSGTQYGSAWYSVAQPVQNGFTTSFTFQFTNPSNPPADGIAFVIQNASAGTAAIGSAPSGGALGYGDDDGNGNPNSGIPNSVAIEFDSFQNTWDPPANPTNGSVSHVAVQSCGTGPNTSHHGQLCPSGHTSTLGLPMSVPNLAAGNGTHTVTIKYTPAMGSTAANIQITLDGNNPYTNGVPVDLGSIGLGDAGTAYVGFTGATGGDFETQDIDNWTFMPVTVTQIGQPVTTGGAGLTQSFPLNTNTGNNVLYEFDFSAASEHLTFPNGNITPFVGFNGISPLLWPGLVKGTALAETFCLTAAGLTDSNGNPECVVNSLTATTSTDGSPSGKNLPQSTARDIVLTQTLDLFTPQAGITAGPGSTFVLNIPPNSAPGMAEFNDSGACPFQSDDPLNNQLCPRSIMTSIQDGPTKPGGTPKPAGSSQVFFCCEREWTTQATLPLWNHTTSISVPFTSTPPGGGSNGFVPAPPLGVLYGATKQNVTLDPVLPNFNSQQIAPAPSACPSSPNWPLTTNPPSGFSSTGPAITASVDASGNTTGLAEGAYNLLYALQDCDEFLNLAYPPTITVAGEPVNPVNLATWPTKPFNIDTTTPTISPITLNPPGGFYAAGTTVTASMTCNDPLGGGGAAASGILSCGGKPAPLANGTGPGSFTNSTPFVTAGSGSQTFSFATGATDVAGNSSGAPAAVPYQVVGGADLSIAIIGNLLVKTGQNITYLIGVANAGPSPAFEIVVNDAIPAGTTFVSAGYAIDSCSFGNGPPSCSIVPPTNSCGSTTGTCTIAGSLPVWTKKNPIGILVQLTVKVTASPNTTIKNAASVGGATNADPNLKNNTTVTWPTLVTK
jgi:uncharacterized repeat protein (TIGR01451 family)